MRRTYFANPVKLLAVLAWILPFAPVARAEDGLVVAGQILFKTHCRICHSDDLAMKSYGPPLVGVVGRRVGSYPGFTYSDALKGAGFIWTAAAIRAWMADNTAMLPGTRMRHVGITDTGEQDLIVAYLKSISH